MKHRLSTPYRPPPPETLETVHVDADFVIANKPSGLLSVPGIGPEKAVCANSILSDRHGPVLTVHRLDMDTSGVMVFARTKDAQRAISRQFERRKVGKTYEALVEGVMAAEAGTIDAPIAKYSLKRPLRHLDPEGQTAITHWRVLDRGADQTRVCLKPETGRSHQLRLHLASLGHAILGDVFYGNPDNYARLCLHAKTLEFDHPREARCVAFETPTPF
ncbi:MAG: RluA family pseudouridine synthase [Pseudomonadota bacterium]